MSSRLGQTDDGSLGVFCVMFPVIASAQAFKVVGKSGLRRFLFRLHAHDKSWSPRHQPFLMCGATSSLSRMWRWGSLGSSMLRFFGAAGLPVTQSPSVNAPCPNHPSPTSLPLPLSLLHFHFDL